MLNLRNKPIQEWTLDDLVQIVDEQWSEDSTFEIKSALQTNKDAKGWAISGKLHASERDGLAREIVGLANNRGGLLVVGIEETDDNPKRAKALGAPLAKVHDLTDQLSRALFSIIDPPIRGLRYKAIIDSGDAGYLLIEVPHSSNAPHGYGQPPQCYVRAGDETKPMTMRDIQSTFWESRTRFERIDALRSEKSDHWSDLPRRQSALSYRFSAIPEDELPIQGLHRRLSSGQFFPTGAQRADRTAASAAPWPFHDREWIVDANCVRRNFNRSNVPFQRGYWEIDQSGAVSIVAEVNGVAMEENETQVWIAWMRTTISDLLTLAKVVANDFGLGESKWWVDGEARSSSPGTRVFYDNTRAVRAGLAKRKHFRPVPIALSKTIVGVEQLDDGLCSMLGVPCLIPGANIQIDYSANLSDLSLS